MAIALTLVGDTSAQSDAGLDQLTEHYKSASAATDILADPSVPQRYSDHPVHSGMVLMQRNVQETGPSASALDLVYQGVLNDSTGNPGPLPPGKHSNSFTVQVAQVSASGLSMSVEALVPTKSFTWLDTQEAVGGGALPDFATATPAKGYIITGKCISSHGSNIITGSGTSFTTEVRVGDHVIIDLLKTQVVAGPGQLYWQAGVTHVNSNTSLTLDTVFTGTSAIPYYSNHSYGIHQGAGLPVKIVSVRMGCGFASLFANIDVTVWGPILLSTYFFQNVVPSVQSEELVPGRYWRNTERNTLNLTPIPC